MCSVGYRGIKWQFDSVTRAIRFGEGGWGSGVYLKSWKEKRKGKGNRKGKKARKANEN